MTSDGSSARGIVRLLNTAGGRVLCLAGDVDGEVVGRFLRRYGPEPVRVDIIEAGSVTSLSPSALDLVLAHLDHAERAGRTVVVRRSPADRGHSPTADDPAVRAPGGVSSRAAAARSMRRVDQPTVPTDRAAPGTGHPKGGRRTILPRPRRRPFRYTLPGLVGALHPPLRRRSPRPCLPRTGLTQGLISGITAAFGYAVGVVAAYVWRAFADREVAADPTALVARLRRRRGGRVRRGDDLRPLLAGADPGPDGRPRGQRAVPARRPGDRRASCSSSWSPSPARSTASTAGWPSCSTGGSASAPPGRSAGSWSPSARPCCSAAWWPINW